MLIPVLLKLKCVHFLNTKKPRQHNADGAFPFKTNSQLHRRHFHVLELHRAVFQHGFYHGIFRYAAREDVFRQLVQNHALEHALQMPCAELWVEAGFAQVIEYFGDGFELDAGLGQALLDLAELDVTMRPLAPFFGNPSLLYILVLFALLP